MQLFNKYLSVEAQIKQAAQADDEKEILRDNKVIELLPNGNELFD